MKSGCSRKMYIRLEKYIYSMTIRAVPGQGCQIFHFLRRFSAVSLLSAILKFSIYFQVIVFKEHFARKEPLFWYRYAHHYTKTAKSVKRDRHRKISHVKTEKTRPVQHENLYNDTIFRIFLHFSCLNI